ncbi:MAG: serine acetyltransferase [Candidatus Latescibacteria bacterium]|nr:serine acetyltransferase [Candidatus Latescibacterota bacterium]
MHTSIDELSRVSSEIVGTYQKYGGINRIDSENLPSRDRVTEILQDLLTLLFPGYIGLEVPAWQDISFFVSGLVHSTYLRLREEITRSLNDPREPQTRGCEERGEAFALALLKKIPDIRATLQMDVQAAYDGDPAARSHDEIILSYPGVLAVATYRLAHELYRMEVPLIPRIMTEWAHGKTGIDIHPGAALGRRFFIDHGTGVVIGETTEIGDDVKIYQGVTLGALSFPKTADGQAIKGGKRHPTIEDGVTIYAGASIFGGRTVIGRGSVIGANASVIPKSWEVSVMIGQGSVIGPNATVMESVPPATRVTIRVDQEITERNAYKQDLPQHEMAVRTARASST